MPTDIVKTPNTKPVIRTVKITMNSDEGYPLFVVHWIYDIFRRQKILDIPYFRPQQIIKIVAICREN